MIRFLGNFSIRLWILALVGGPVCFYVMPLFTKLFPGIPPKAGAGIFIVCLGLVIGAILDRVGKNWIIRKIKQGKAWERAGLLFRAEKTYTQAVGIYDTVLLSPWFGRKTGILLAGALARFALISGIENPGFKLAASVYLRSHPEDETLAGLWLGQHITQGMAGPLDQEVLTSLADAHHAHKKLVFLLADILLAQGRMDYSAKRLYKNLLEDPELSSAVAPEMRQVYRKKIHRLLGVPEEKPQTSPASRPLSIEKKGPIRSIPISLGRIGPRPLYVKQRVSFFRRAIEFVTKGVRGVVSGLGSLFHFSGRAVAYARAREEVGFYLKAAFMGGISLWLLFFMWNTFSHLLKSKAVETPTGMVEVQVPKPFTIQVAAYLEKAHADRYLAFLTKKEIGAVVKVVGGGGKTWYVVRVSEFPDKVSAAAYGNQLKAQKLIEDFFVCNK